MADETRPLQCSDHGDLSKAIGSLNTAVSDLRADVKWFLRIGTGIFSICGIVTTLMSPVVVRMYGSINDLQKAVLILQETQSTQDKELARMQDTERRIIDQRNKDHVGILP